MKILARVPWQFILLLLLISIWVVIMPRDAIPIQGMGGEWATITNTTYDFSVDYPARWRAEIYGENGYRGLEEIKLQIYRSTLDQLFITVRYQKKVQPALEDVAAWRTRMIASWNDALRLNHEPVYEELTANEGSLRGQPIRRRQYSNGVIHIEDVYLARADDMIIISLSADEARFEGYRDDFEGIVESFRPVE